MAVSTRPPHRPTKATTVSDNQATWPTGPGCGARGPFRAHVNPMTCTWAAPPTCRSRGLRAHQRVNAHVQGLACEQHTMPGAVVPKARAQAPSIGGGIALHEAPTRRRHASRGLHVVQNPPPPPAWRPPEGQQGLARQRADAPSDISREDPTGVEGAGGTGGHGRASRRGAERSEDA